jgi:hypothetical protein
MPALSPEAYSTTETPATIAEKSERIPDASHEDIAFALGRLLIWLIAPYRSNSHHKSSAEAVGIRTLILVYKLRADLLDGASFNELSQAAATPVSVTALHKLAKRFTETFGIRGHNGRVDTRRYRAAWARNNPNTRRLPSTGEHLDIINRFTEWQARAARSPSSLPTTSHAAHQMLIELSPIRSFINKMEQMADCQ